MDQVVIYLVRTVCQQFLLLTLTQTSKSIARAVTKAALDLVGKKFYRICSAEKIFSETVLKY